MTGQKPSGRLPAFLTVSYFLVGIGWLFEAGRTDSEQNRYANLIFGVIFLALAATGAFLAWKRSREAPPPNKS